MEDSKNKNRVQGSKASSSTSNSSLIIIRINGIPVNFSNLSPSSTTTLTTTNNNEESTRVATTRERREVNSVMESIINRIIEKDNNSNIGQEGKTTSSSTSSSTIEEEEEEEDSVTLDEEPSPSSKRRRLLLDDDIDDIDGDDVDVDDDDDDDYEPPRPEEEEESDGDDDSDSDSLPSDLNENEHHLFSLSYQPTDTFPKKLCWDDQSHPNLEPWYPGGPVGKLYYYIDDLIQVQFDDDDDGGGGVVPFNNGCYDDDSGVVDGGNNNNDDASDDEEQKKPAAKEGTSSDNTDAVPFGGDNSGVNGGNNNNDDASNGSEEKKKPADDDEIPKEGVSDQLNNDCLMVALTKFTNVLDLYAWKSVSKDFGMLCTNAIKSKCTEANNGKTQKRFESSKELRSVVVKWYEIKYEPMVGYHFNYENMKDYWANSYDANGEPYFDELYPGHEDNERFKKPKWATAKDSEGGGEEQRQSDAEDFACTYGLPIDCWIFNPAITSFWGIFKDLKLINDDIGSWNTSNVTIMDEMFCGSVWFNQDISKWNTSKVTSTAHMFWDALSFNQPSIRKWDMSNVHDLSDMFIKVGDFKDIKKLPWFRPEMITVDRLRNEKPPPPVTTTTTTEWNVPYREDTTGEAASTTANRGNSMEFQPMTWSELVNAILYNEEPPTWSEVVNAIFNEEDDGK